MDPLAPFPGACHAIYECTRSYVSHALKITAPYSVRLLLEAAPDKSLNDRIIREAIAPPKSIFSHPEAWLLIFGMLAAQPILNILGYDTLEDLLIQITQCNETIDTIEGSSESSDTDLNLGDHLRPEDALGLDCLVDITIHFHLEMVEAPTIGTLFAFALSLLILLLALYHETP